MTYQQENSDRKPAIKNGNEAGLAPIKESVATLGQHVKEDAAAVAQTAKDQAQKKVDGISAEVDSYVDVLKKDLTEKPIQTVAIAFAAGAIVSLLLGRR